MDFISAAPDYLAGYLCQDCDDEVQEGQPVYYDVDLGADDRPKARVWCVGCQDTGRED